MRECAWKCSDERVKECEGVRWEQPRIRINNTKTASHAMIGKGTHLSVAAHLSLWLGNQGLLFE